jgi:hypothetical protein
MSSSAGPIGIEDRRRMKRAEWGLFLDVLSGARKSLFCDWYFLKQNNFQYEIRDIAPGLSRGALMTGIGTVLVDVRGAGRSKRESVASQVMP